MDVKEWKNDIDIVDVVSRYVNLKRQGNAYIGLCPFHSEKTPSFSVNRDKQFYHCFGCGESGDVISFVERIENVDFKEAVEIIGRITGRSFDFCESRDADSAKRDMEKKNHVTLNTYAQRLYSSSLAKNRAALDYLTGRGLKKEVIQEFGLGLSPDSWNALSKKLSDKHIPEEIILESGLCARSKKGNLYDRFRNRIMFPIEDSRGNIIAFGGRVFNGEGREVPKYVNSPENDHFHKREVVYNLRRARKSETCILTEGYMDVVSLYNQGVTNAVAALGTSFTECHAEIIRNSFKTCIICLDGDLAGMKGTDKALKLLDKDGYDVRVLRLPCGEDPDSFIKTHSAEVFREAVKRALTPDQYRLKRLAGHYMLDVAAERKAFVKEALVILADADPAEAPVLAEYVSKKGGVKIPSLRKMVKSLKK